MSGSPAHIEYRGQRIAFAIQDASPAASAVLSLVLAVSSIMSASCVAVPQRLAVRSEMWSRLRPLRLAS